jgi:hypothetical protein
MGEADFLDEFELRMLRKGGNGLRNPEHGANDVVGRIAVAPRT